MSSDDRAVTLREQVAPVVRALEQSLGDSLVSVVLFGSRARGEARPDSDWDLLVIYVAAKLAYLQRRISELGLRRVELNGDRVWLCRNPPGSQWSLEWTQ